MAVIEEPIGSAEGASGAGGESDAALLIAMFDIACDGLARLEPGERLGVIATVADRVERERLAAAAAKGEGCRKRTKAALRDPNRSNRSVNRDARRAEAMAKNPHLADKVRDGDVAPDSVDSLFDTADDEGVIADDLVDDVSGVGPDQARRIAADHAAENASQDEVDKRYERQWKDRTARRYQGRDAFGRPTTAGISIEGPDEIIDRIWARICREADRAYQGAGGRDVPGEEHPDTWEQRLFDAAAAVFNGSSGESVRSDGAGGGVGGSGGGARSRPDVVIVLPIDGSGVATQVGTGPIASADLVRLVGDARLSVLLTDLVGQPLWLGRANRRATRAQFLALVVRDRGCVLCGAGIERCAAHHLMPWTAPGKGRTDIDSMALLCEPCHRDLHDRNHTLYRRRSPSGSRVQWAIRPATAAETPAARRSSGAAGTEPP